MKALTQFLLIAVAHAAASGAETPVEVALWGDTSLAAAEIGKYEGRAEGRPDRWLTGVESPVVSVYRPAEGRGTGAAVVVFPGGGYSGQAIDKEGHFVAGWLADRGVVAAVVPYRCGAPEFRYPAPQADAKRAVRLVRSHAAQWGVDPAKVGVMGFSAGGHLAAITAVTGGEALPGITDSLAAISDRPDFAVLVYPVISLRPEVSHGGSARNLLGDDPPAELVARLSADERVTGKTPPTLLVHSADDPAVPAANPMRFFEACLRAKVPVELHLYETGGHGYGMWPTEGTVAAWPHALESWLANRGYATTPEGVGS